MHQVKNQARALSRQTQIFGFIAGVAALMSAAAHAQSASNLATKEAPIAVFSQSQFPYIGGYGVLPPRKIAEQFQSSGLAATTLSLEQLQEAGVLTPAHYAALVLPYGNAFPAEAFPALRAYQKAGGILVLNGVPFTHPIVRKADAWSDLGHSGKYLAHSAEGIGSGNFTDPYNGVLKVATPAFAPNPLGLRAEDLPREKTSLQVLAASSLPPEDEVVPLIEIIDDRTQQSHAVSALIRHHCAQFDGALTLWLGPIANGTSGDDAFLATQLLLRSTAWALRENKRISPAQMQAVFQAASKLAKPTPLPSDLKFRALPRPWGDTYLPKSKRPARRLTVVNLKNLPKEQAIALTCLQALSSRRQPSLYLLTDEASQFFLDWHVEQKYLDGYNVAADWKAPFAKFKRDYKGAVVADEKLYHGQLLALNVATMEDLIVLTPEMARELKIPVKIDLRGRFKTYAQGLQWVIDKYGDQISRHLAHYAAPTRLDFPSYAYAMQWHGLLLWPSGPAEIEKPGVDALQEKIVAARAFARMASDGVVLGFPYAGTGIGLGEGDGVELTSAYGLGHIASDYAANLTILSGFPAPDLKQQKQAAGPKLERDKIYIALNVSDGDNMSVWNGWKNNYFTSPRVGEFPIAFGSAPAMLDTEPGVLQWYYKKGGATTEFFPDVSGIAYTQPDNFAKAFAPAERDKVWQRYIDWTKRYMARLDMHTLRTVGGSDENLIRYAKQIPLHSIFGDMGRYSGREGIANLTYTLPPSAVGGTGMPVFRAVTSWRYGADGFLPEVRTQVGTQRPAFVNGFVHAWTWNNTRDIAKIYDARDKDMVFVTPTQLAALYREAVAQGMTK